MNLGECKKKALSLMAEYSVDGILIPTDENEDYLNRMNRFASDAQMEISNKVGIETSYTFHLVADPSGGYTKHLLPDDYKEYLYLNYQDEHFRDYRIENRKLLIPKTYDGEFELFYYKHPIEITPDTNESYEFEVTKHAQHLIPYFVAGMAVQDEKQAISDRLLNLYYSMLNNLRPLDDEASNDSIRNVYGW